MSPLEQLRADQHMGERTQNDERLEMFLAEKSLDDARCDYAPVTQIEIRHLARARSTA